MKIPDIAEQRAIKLFTNEFGIDKRIRFNKFKEEINELEEAFEYYMNSDEEDKIEALSHLLDEFSDVQGTFTHLTSLFSLYQREMLYNCIDKVTTRKTNPGYKRFDNVGFINRVKVSLIPVPEYDHPKGYPVAVQKNNYWVKPDPRFYYNNVQIEDAWKRYIKGESVKMVKCNEQGIITGNSNESFEPGDHNNHNDI